MDTIGSPADSRDMIAVHDMYRREFASFPELVRGVAAGDRDRAALVAEHVSFVVALLHAHHGSEDDLVWPKLAERAPADVAPLLATMHADHEEIDRRLGDVDTRLAGWREEADVAGRDRVADALDALLPPLTGHLATEEAEALTLIDEHLTAAEWAEVGNAGLAEIPPSRHTLLFGMLLHDMDPEMYRLVQETVPAEVFDVVAAAGPEEYRRHRARLHGTGEPS